MTELDQVFHMLKNVDEIHFGDDVYRKVDMSDDELSEFFDDMTSDHV